MVELLEIKRQLGSTTLKHRREAVKQLDVQLDSPHFLHQLDTGTIKLWPEDRLQLVSWPGLLDTYLSYVHKEVAVLRKSLDATGLRVLKRIFLEADNPERCGPGRAHLLRRAGAAFDKFWKVLEADTAGESLGTPLGREVAAILGKVLLPSAAYCQRGTVQAFQGLLEEAMARCDKLQQDITQGLADAAKEATTAAAASRMLSGARGGGRASAAAAVQLAQQEMASLAGLLAGLLAGMPGQMEDLFVLDTLTFLATQLQWLDKQRQYGRVDAQLMSCLNGLLLTYGADLRAALPSAHACLADYVRHAWAERTNARVKEGVLCYCRLALALGALPGPAAVTDLLGHAIKDITAPNFSWDLLASRQHQQLAALAASLFYHTGLSGSGGPAGTATGSAAAAAAAARRPGGQHGHQHATPVGSCGSCGSDTPAGGAGGLRRSAAAAAAGQGGVADMDVDGAAAAAAAAAGAPEGGGGGGADDDEHLLLQLPRKRSRVMGHAGQLLTLLDADPERWGPVVALLLHQHGALVAPAFLAALQQQLCAGVTRALAALSPGEQQQGAGAAGAAAGGRGGPAGRRSASPGPVPGPTAPAGAAATSRGQTQQHLLWLLRCAAALALCWPACLHPLAAAATAARQAGSTGSGPEAAGAHGLPGSYGPAYDASEGACTHEPWAPAAAAAAASAAAASWQRLWEACEAHATAAGSRLLLRDALAWLLHVMAALQLVRLPSKQAALIRLLGLWLPAAGQQQQQAAAGAQDAAAAAGGGLGLDPGEGPAAPQQHAVLGDAQLALLLSLCLGQPVASQRELLARQELLGACLSTARACCGAGGSSRAARPSAAGQHRPSFTNMPPPFTAAAAAGAPAAAAPAALCLPPLLLPAMLALLEAPGLPTPGLNGSAGAAAAGAGAAAAGGPGSERQPGWLFGSPAQAAPPGGGTLVWYDAAAVWCPADARIEQQLAGLQGGLEHLQRRHAALQLQQLLQCAAAAAAAEAAGSGAPQSSAALLLAAAAAEGGGEAAADSSGWWQSWRQLADSAADLLTHELLCFVDDDSDNPDQAWGASQDDAGGGGGPAAAADPVKQLCHMLLLLNAAVSLPSIAAIKWQEQQDGQERRQQPQQRQQHADMFCGFGFSQHWARHVQLQKLVMDVAIKAGLGVAENLHKLPCAASSTWLEQLQHLGASLARLQALMLALPGPNGPDPSKVNYEMLAAASILAEVVKVVERTTAAAADAAAAPLDEARAGAGADADFDDDFFEAPVPARSRAPALSQQQHHHQGGSMAGTQGPSQAWGAAASRAPTGAAAAAAAPAGAAAAASGFAVAVGGGLAGFSGPGGLGVLAPALPALQPPQQQLFAATAAAGGGWGFAAGGVGEGLASLGGVEGAGLRVFAALAPAYGDTAQAVLRLWAHMAALAGWAPSDALLQAVVETACTGVCAGGWSHLGQLLGLIQGSHTLLAAQKVPLSTLHLILRLLQHVAAAAAAAGLQLDVPCAVFASQQQASAGSQQQQQQAAHAGVEQTTYLDMILEVFSDVWGRLDKWRRGGRLEHLPLSTQLQLGLTVLALLQLQPHDAGYRGLPAAAVAAAAGAAKHDCALWRRDGLLALLSADSHALRMRAGPLVGHLLAFTAAAAGRRSGASVAAAVAEAMEDVQGCLILQGSPQPTPAQAERSARRERALQDRQLAGQAGIEAAAEERAAERAAQQEAGAWETAILQVVDLARASGTAAAAALQQQELPNALDARLLLLLLRHAANVQLLPDHVLPLHASQQQQQAPAGRGSNSGGGAAAGGAAGRQPARAAALQLLAAALDVMGVQQQYASRFAHLLYHGRAWAKGWVAAGCSAAQLLKVLVLICPPAELLRDSCALCVDCAPELPAPAAAQPAAAAGDAASAAAEAAAQRDAARVMLRCYGGGLVFWAIFYDAQAVLDGLAAAAGLQEPALLLAFTHVTCSCVYPALKVPELKLQAGRFRKKLSQSPESLSQDDALGLVFPLLEGCLPVVADAGQQQQQQPGGSQEAPSVASTLPFCSLAAANAGFATLAKSLQGQGQQPASWLTALGVSAAGIQRLLLLMHRSLAAAASPLHKLQRLGQFQCLLQQLPPEQLRSPAVAHSLVSMLVQHVQEPLLQAACCGCLRVLFEQLFAALEAAAVAAAGGAHKAERKGGAGDKQLQLQQAAALLAALLPPTVAALVQCVETASASLLQQHLQHEWALVPNAAAAAAAAAASRGGVRTPLLPCSYAPVQLLDYVFSSPPRRLAAVYQSLDLLPPVPALALAGTSQHRMQQGVGLAKAVVAFAGRAASMSASSRHRKVRVLRGQLQHSSTAAGLFQQPPAAAATGASANRGEGGCSSDSQAGEWQRPAMHPAVAAAAYQLARLGAELCDSQVTALAAQLLALAGPLPPDAITLSSTSMGGGGGHADGGSSSSSVRKEPGFPMLGVLQQLVECLFDCSPRVVQVAQATLAQLVPEVDMKAILQSLQANGSSSSSGTATTIAGPAEAAAVLLPSYLATFGGSSEGGQRPPHEDAQEAAAAAAAAAAQAAASAELWDPLGQPYSSWLCRLCSTLLLACGAVDKAPAARSSRSAAAAAAGLGATPPGAVLQLLAASAALRPQLAELLLPHALLKLCESDDSGADAPGTGSQGWAARLGEVIVDSLQLGSLVQAYANGSSSGSAGGVLGAGGDGLQLGGSAACTSAGVDARCISVLLACLEHNRAVHRAAMMALPCASPLAPTGWHRCYCLHIDYLTVAAAAMAVRAYFTALLYVEHHCEQYTPMTYNPSFSSQADNGLLQLQRLAGLGRAEPGGGAQQQLLEQLLLDLYSNVNEPDGIYAVTAAFGGPRSRLQLMRHEQQWASVLGAQDALLQAAAMQHSAQAPTAAGVLTALQRLGCESTAQLCISGAFQQQQQQQQQQQPQAGSSIPWPPPGLPQHGQQLGGLQRQQQQDLLEAQHELAWRLSDWGLADSVLHGPGHQPSFSANLRSVSISSTASTAISTASTAAKGAADGGDLGPQGFHAAVLSALAALQDRDLDGFSTSVLGAQQQCVLQLTRSSTESTAAVNPLLVQLQMLHMLSQALHVARASGSSAAAPGATAAAAVAQADGAREVLQQLLGVEASPDGTPAAARQLSSTAFHLSDQLLALQAALCKVLGRPDALALTLQATASTARQAGAAAFAGAALQQLQQLLRQAVLGARASAAGLPGGLPAAALLGSGDADAVQLPAWLQDMLAVDAEWPFEELQLQWLQGQHLPALNGLHGLVAAARDKMKQVQQQLKEEGRGGALASQHLRLMRAVIQGLLLLGRWLAAGHVARGDTVRQALTALRSAASVVASYQTWLPQEQQQQPGGAAACEQQQQQQRQEGLHCQVYFELARFSDSQFQQLEAQMTSPEGQKQEQVLANKVALLQELNAASDQAMRELQALPPAKQGPAVEAKRRIDKRRAETQRQVNVDRQVREAMLAARQEHLAAAMAAYRDCVSTGDAYDLQVVYRLCSLWFTNAGELAVNQLMQEVFLRVPRAKFVPLVYQIASRMNTTRSNFQVILTQALHQLARDHPYHCLYPLIALRHGDTEGDKAGAAKEGQVKHQADRSKVAAAAELLAQLAQDEQLRPIVDDMQAQVRDIIDMTLQVHRALPRARAGHSLVVSVSEVPMPAQYRRRLKSLRHAPPVCLSLPLDPTCAYEDVPHVVDIDASIKLIGGINAPLVVRTTDSAGHVQRQLCKCNDDLRQDAVMQQFFRLIDTLLGSNQASRLRRLRLRTYKVVPCSPLVGVVEWVEGTLPLTELLIGAPANNYNSPLSARYRPPSALSWMECRTLMGRAAAKPETLPDTFDHVCKHAPPVFHHWFLEAFPHPGAWFEARARFTRSTAVASMAGAIIGLGDRHMGNILLDTSSAEVVHIDLGIAFEQGRFLPTPERVPFRLTANIVDGMGAAGVEGTFRRCCEVAVQVLRDNQEALLTVVQVVLHDPMYSWQMSPVKAGRKQQDTLADEGGDADGAAPGGSGAGGSAGGAAAAAAAASAAPAGGGGSGGGSGGSEGLGNADAERAVLRVKQKLQGQDVAGGALLSVGAYVGALIQAARDGHNLAHHFVGWAAWT